MRRSAVAGIVASTLLPVAVAAPYLLVPDTGTGLPIYYGAGPAGGHVVAVLALLQIVVILAGERGGADAATAAGVGATLALATLALATVWAVSVRQEVVFSFPAAWMGWHRWAVVALAALVAASSGAHARSALS